MDKIKKVYTKNAPEPVGPYSQAVTYRGIVYCSGQIPIDPGTGLLISGNIEDEAGQVLENLKSVLIKAGASLETTLRVTIYLTDIMDFNAVNGVYARYFTGEPARSCIQVAALPKGARVEMDAIAAII